MGGMELPKEITPLSEDELAEFEREQLEWYDIDPNMFDVGPQPLQSLRLVATVRTLQATIQQLGDRLIGG